MQKEGQRRSNKASYLFFNTAHNVLFTPVFIFIFLLHNFIIFPPPTPPPHLFYTYFPSTTTTTKFLLFPSTTTTTTTTKFLLFPSLPPPPPPPHFYCFPLPPPHFYCFPLPPPHFYCFHHQQRVRKLISCVFIRNVSGFIASANIFDIILIKGQKVDFLCLYKKRVWFHCELVLILL